MGPHALVMIFGHRAFSRFARQGSHAWRHALFLTEKEAFLFVDLQNKNNSLVKAWR